MLHFFLYLTQSETKDKMDLPTNGITSTEIFNRYQFRHHHHSAHQFMWCFRKGVRPNNLFALKVGVAVENIKSAITKGVVEAAGMFVPKSLPPVSFIYIISLAK